MVRGGAAQTVAVFAWSVVLLRLHRKNSAWNGRMWKDVDSRVSTNTPNAVVHDDFNLKGAGDTYPNHAEGELVLGIEHHLATEFSMTS